MKKAYYPPQLTVYDLQTRCPLLAGSNDEIYVGGNPVDNGDALSRDDYFDDEY